MPDTKISALPAAGALAGTELLVAVQGGADVQTTTQDVANLGAGTWVTVNTPIGGACTINCTSTASMGLVVSDNGQGLWNFQQGSSIQMFSGPTLCFQMTTPLGNVIEIISNGQTWTMQTSGGGSIVLNDFGNTLVESGFAATNRQFIAPNPGYWGGPGVPLDLESAIDRIAAVVSAGGGTPIP
jgi:hypothetical protein